MNLLKIASVFIFCSLSLYGNQISVSPTYFELSSKAGEAIQENVVVYNSSATVMRVQISVGDFWYDRKGNRSFPMAGSSPYSGASWITLTQKEIEVPARGQVNVPFVFAVPGSAPPSSYATLFIERAPEAKSSKDGKASNVNLSLRIAVPILYKKPEASVERIDLSSLKITRPTAFKPLLVKFNIQNNDELHLFPQGNVTIVKGTEKELVAKDELPKEKLVLPKQNVPFELSLPIEPKSGKYEGLLTLFYGQEKSIVKNFSFSIP